MRAVPGLIISLCCAAVEGCVTSVQPYVTEQSAVFAPELVGAWADSAGREQAVVTKTGVRLYGITYTDDNGETKRFKGRLGRIGAYRVLDLESNEPLEPGNESGTHLALVLDTLAPRVAIAVLEPDTLIQYLSAHPEAIAHRLRKDETVLTAGSDELVKFLAAYLRQPDVLSERTTWVRRGP